MHTVLPQQKTKKALKSAVASGVPIFFKDTSMFDPVDYDTDDLPNGKTLYIVGPHEYDRRWFAQVKRGRDGKVVVS